MIALETSLLRVATQTVIQVIRPLLPDLKARKQRFAELSELVNASVGDFLTRRKVREQLERMVTDVFARFQARAEQEFRHLPEHEIAAALAAVSEALSGHELTDEALFKVDLDHRKLARSVRDRTTPPDGLSADAETVYSRLLDIACLCLVRLVIQLEPFQSRASVEMLARLTTLADDVERVLDRLPFTSLDAPEGAEKDEDFRFRYLEFVTSTMDRLDLLGVPVSQRSSVRLSVAYLNLRADGGRESRLSKVLGAHRRTFIRGEAGCGKSTLLRWLAVTAAGSRFREELEHWNGQVPLLVKLRSFAEVERLPRPDEFFAKEADPLFQLLPAGWVHRQLLGGQAILLIDGVDELPHQRRDLVRSWLQGLVRTYPHARYVITSRPAAAAQDWLSGLEFHSAAVQPMGEEEVEVFVRRWHEAIRGRAGCADDELPAFQDELLRQLSVQGHLRALAVSPLLCAMLCALNLDRETQLPKDRTSLYQAALEMLLVNRDQSRNIRTDLDQLLDLQAKQTLLQRLAWHLTLNELSEVDRKQVEQKFTEAAKAMIRLAGKELSGETILNYLIERSGVIREPVVGRIDFVHLTLQEFLAAKEIVEENHIPRLVKEAHEPSWREVLLMTPGQATNPQRVELFSGLLDRADREAPDLARKLRLLVITAMANPRPIREELRRRIEQVAMELLPPVLPDEIRELAAAGEWLLDFMPTRSEPLDSSGAANCVELAVMIGGPRAQRLLAGYVADTRAGVQFELVAGWSSFDPGRYAREILADAPLHPGWVSVEGPDMYPHLPLLRRLRRLRTTDTKGLPPLPLLTGLQLARARKVDLDRLVDQFPVLDTVALVNARRVTGIPALTRLPNLRVLTLLSPDVLPSLAPLKQLRGLEVLTLGHRCTGMDLQLVAELPKLRDLMVFGLREPQALEVLQRAKKLEHFGLEGGLDSLDLAPLARCGNLRSLTLWNLAPDTDLSPLLALPLLETVHTNNKSDDQDLRPLLRRGVKLAVTPRIGSLIRD
ncbi:NACHT domain-containing protein [Crossiella sp. CA-258035]|uniref:NACHT domain-containing protein n=1 Tax=Crossiella sp. CA-258035 TaxID=2981138 RepID=UPI0024BC69E2|nr:NACHT domain-containing protein [Crossiella sp. CA-258035]WHT16983.1 NACHT domain-containing protein [Crossiella sp. CA-258035]